MLTIHISGPRGEGKTAAAIEIARMLVNQGHDVAYHHAPRCELTELHVEELTCGLPQDIPVWEQRQILIIDQSEEAVHSSILSVAEFVAHDHAVMAEALSDRDLLEELEDRLGQSDESLHALNSIRATLLVNFGEGRESNVYGFTVKDEGTTHSMMIEVLEALTAGNVRPMSYAERERLAQTMIERWKAFANQPLVPTGT